jgi:hypothetical protein
MKVLVALSPSAYPVLRDCLPKDAQLVFISHLRDAERTLLIGFDGFVLGVFWDGGRMFELLRLLKADSTSRDKPILCVRAVATQGPFPDLHIPCAELGATAYFDYFKVEAECGTTRAAYILGEQMRTALGLASVH